MTRVETVREIARGCFKPEFQEWAGLLDESIARNPIGWETWFALKNDEHERAMS